MSKAITALIALNLVVYSACVGRYAAPTEAPVKKAEVQVVRFPNYVDETSGSAFVDQFLSAARASSVVVVVFGNASGGLLLEAQAIREVVTMTRIKTVCVVERRAASAALWVYSGCHVRLVLSGSYLVAHGVVWQLADGGSRTSAESEREREAREMYWSAMAVQITSRSRLTPSEYRSRTVDGEQWFISSDAAVAYGLAEATTPSVRAVVDAVADAMAGAQ